MTKSPAKQSFDTLFQMMAAFPDEQSAIDHFTAIRWADGAFCPLCGSTRVYHSATIAPISAAIAVSVFRSRSGPFLRIVRSDCANG